MAPEHPAPTVTVRGLAPQGPRTGELAEVTVVHGRSPTSGRYGIAGHLSFGE